MEANESSHRPATDRDEYFASIYTLGKRIPRMEAEFRAAVVGNNLDRVNI